MFLNVITMQFYTDMNHRKQSRDLYPKEKLDPNRWPWREEDHGPTDKRMLVAAAIGFCSPIIFSVAWYFIHLMITS